MMEMMDDVMMESESNRIRRFVRNPKFSFWSNPTIIINK